MQFGSPQNISGQSIDVDGDWTEQTNKQKHRMAPYSLSIMISRNPKFPNWLEKTLS